MKRLDTICIYSINNRMVNKLIWMVGTYIRNTQRILPSSCTRLLKGANIFNTNSVITFIKSCVIIITTFLYISDDFYSHFSSWFRAGIFVLSMRSLPSSNWCRWSEALLWKKSGPSIICSMSNEIQQTKRQKVFGR